MEQKQDNKRKVLSAVNFTHKNYGLKRSIIKEHNALSSVIYNFRKLIHSLGYDCSLLNDSEILAFEEVIQQCEQEDNFDYLKEILDFLC